MPRVSEFYGIIIAMYYREHGVPHFRATYAGDTVVKSIESGEAIAGSVPPRAMRLIDEWLLLHRDELQLNWARPGRYSAGRHRPASVGSLAWTSQLI